MGWKKANGREVLPSAARTTTLTVDLDDWAEMFDECFFVVDVTVNSGTGQTLDIAYQVKSLAGNWVDHTTLTQIGAANGVFLLKVPDNIGIESRLNIVIAGTTPSYTFDIKGVGKMSGGRG